MDYRLCACSLNFLNGFLHIISYTLQSVETTKKLSEEQNHTVSRRKEIVKKKNDFQTKWD